MTTSDTSGAQTPTPIQFLPGAMSAQVPGHISSMGQQLTYSLQAQAGQFMIVNVISTTPGMGTEGTVQFPGGGGTGQPGPVVMNQTLQQSGTYTIQVGQSQMASNLPQGDLLVEVIILPSSVLSNRS
ncbi:MAG TPA: hypothetical protein VHG08_20660 [Longimicrobium sp.]|nr:hypothetical protein [Longimicrobium sp.]